MKENLGHVSLHSISLFLIEEKKVQEAQTKSLLFDQFSMHLEEYETFKKDEKRERENHTHTNVWLGTSKTPFQRSKVAISELPFCYLPPMNQIITKK